MVNKWLFIPLIMHQLCAAQNNMQLDQALETKALHDIVHYTMRHHMHQFGVVNCRAQYCMAECYNLPRTEFVTSGTNNITGATLFIAETINIALNGVHGSDTDNVEMRRKHLDTEATRLATMYNTVSSYSNYPTISLCLESLGKVASVIPLFHGILFTLTVRGFTFVHRNVVPC